MVAGEVRRDGVALVRGDDVEAAATLLDGVVRPARIGRMVAGEVRRDGVALVRGDAVEAAATLLDGVVRRTPLEHSRALAERVGGPVWLKCENLQRTGSFKIRGAYTRLARLSAEERARGVVAASAGNHAQGVALAAQLLGICATVFMPESAPLPKVAATRGYGAEARLGGASLTEALAAAAEHAQRTGGVVAGRVVADHPGTPAVERP